MIVPMSKIYVVSRMGDRDRLLDALGSLGVLHVEPVHPDEAIADEQTLERLSQFNQAIRILQGVPPQGPVPDENPLHAAREAILLHKAIAEEREQLAALHRLAAQLAPWGHTSLADLQQLRIDGIEVQFYTLAQSQVAQLMDQAQAECVEVLGTQPGNQCLVGVIDRTGRFEAPPDAKPLPWPAQDLPTVKEEAKVLDDSIQQNATRLAALAQLMDRLQAARDECDTEAQRSLCERSGLSSADLFAIQGWIPATQTDALPDRLSARGISTALHVSDIGTDEQPPTLIKYPRWSMPIKALFDMLGTLPGYREVDLAPFFMIGLPLFAAMLIGDAGYGLILAACGFGFYQKITRSAGKPAAQLLIVFGLVTLVWGIMTGNYFGITPQTFIDTHPGIADTLAGIAPLWRYDPVEGRVLIMKLSLIIGCLHLIVAHLRQVVALWPNVKAFAEIGWIVILGDMLLLVWYLMFIGPEQIPAVLGYIILIAVIGVSWCAEPQANPVKRVLTGFASSILPLLGTFSDIMSYIRLFAVGLASYYIAAAFNGLGAQVAETATWFAGAPVVLFGHALNLALAAIAIFAHGVRLNMLEFSNNVGVKWAGYAYQPFRST